ncbi:MAG: ABC transporter permease [Rhodothermia bacterium]
MLIQLMVVEYVLAYIFEADNSAAVLEVLSLMLLAAS